MKMCEYIEKVWEEGDSRNWATDAVSGLMHFIPSLRGQLRGSQRLLRAWSKMELPTRAPPLPTVFAAAVAGAALQIGDVRLCAALLVAFHAFLRTGELLKVRAGDFVLQGQDKPVLLSPPITKSGQRLKFAPESVTITDLYIILKSIIL